MGAMFTRSRALPSQAAWADRRNSLNARPTAVRRYVLGIGLSVFRNRPGPRFKCRSQRNRHKNVGNYRRTVAADGSTNRGLWQNQQRRLVFPLIGDSGGEQAALGRCPPAASTLFSRLPHCLGLTVFLPSGESRDHFRDSIAEERWNHDTPRKKRPKSLDLPDRIWYRTVLIFFHCPPGESRGGIHLNLRG